MVGALKLFLISFYSMCSFYTTSSHTVHRTHRYQRISNTERCSAQNNKQHYVSCAQIRASTVSQKCVYRENDVGNVCVYLVVIQSVASNTLTITETSRDEPTKRLVNNSEWKRFLLFSNKLTNTCIFLLSHTNV